MLLYTDVYYVSLKIMKDICLNKAFNGDYKDMSRLWKAFQWKVAITTALLAFHFRDEFLKIWKLKKMLNIVADLNVISYYILNLKIRFLSFTYLTFFFNHLIGKKYSINLKDLTFKF